MSCCGQKRLHWQESPMNQQGPAPLPPEPVNPVPIRYDGRSIIMIKGENSGFLYIFAPGEEGLPVDERDVSQILAESKKFSLAEKQKK